MARTAAAVALATLPERVSVLETKVDNIEEKLDDIKVDVKDMHDCLDRTRDSLILKLDDMTNEYRDNAVKYYEHANELNAQQSAQHYELAGKIGELEKFKQKWMMYVMILLAFGAGTGWFDKLDIPHIIKFIGL